jgi:hypothetical protein
MCELPPEQLQLRAKCYCAVAILNLFAYKAMRAPRDMDLPIIRNQMMSCIHVVVLRTVFDKSGCSSASRLLPEERVRWRSGTDRAPRLYQLLSQAGKSQPGLAGNIQINNPGRRLHHS